VRDCTGAAGACIRREIGSCACPVERNGGSRKRNGGSRKQEASSNESARRPLLPASRSLLPPSYADRVALARDFLAGRSDVPLEVLGERMREASESWQFERAGAIKAKLEQLAWLRGRLERFHADVDRLTFVYRAEGHGGEKRVYLVRRGTLRAELAAPADAEGERELAALVARVFDGPDPKGRDIPTHDLDELYLVASWFRRHPLERERTFKA
jgi:excinuclease ABC subunit C